MPEQNTQILAEKDVSQVLNTTKRQYVGVCRSVTGRGWQFFVGVVPGIWAFADGLGPEALLVT